MTAADSTRAQRRHIDRILQDAERLADTDPDALEVLGMILNVLAQAPEDEASPVQQMADICDALRQQAPVRLFPTFDRVRASLTAQ